MTFCKKISPHGGVVVSDSTRKWEYDLVVAGGGTAGSVCAISAAREGLRVAVIERNTFLGGIAGGAGLAEMNAAGFRGEPLYGGIEKELFDELIRRGAAEYHFGVPMSSNPDVKIDRLRYNPEILKIVLEEKAVAEGVDIFYETNMSGAEEREEACLLRADGTDESHLFCSKYMVDATGNGRLVRKLGYETAKQAPESLAVSTLGFRLSGVDFSPLQKAIACGDLGPTISQGYERGILKGRILAFSPIPGTDDVSVNVTRAKLDHEDTASLTNGIIFSRRQIDEVLAFIKQHVPGLSRAYISSIASIMGVRDSRRLVGRYCLTMEDLESMRVFDDAVAIGCYPMDVHGPATNSVVWKMLPGVYGIPFGSLLPKESRRTLVAGKCISADERAFAAVRVMPIMMNVGESAGYAVALAHRKGISLSDIDGAELHRMLREKGIRFQGK